MKARTLFYVVVMIAASECALGRELVWASYKKLVSNSDMVVIASPVQGATTSIDLSSDADWALYLGDAEIAKKVNLSIRGQRTRFNVRAMVKGPNDMEAVEVTYPVAIQKLDFILNGPIVVDLPCLTSTETLAKSQSDANVFILFLKKSSEGKYVPVSGLFDSGFSFQQLKSP